MPSRPLPGCSRTGRSSPSNHTVGLTKKDSSRFSSAKPDHHQSAWKRKRERKKTRKQETLYSTLRLSLSALIIFATNPPARRNAAKTTEQRTSRLCRLHLSNHPLSSRSSLSFTHRFARALLPASLPLVVLLSHLAIFCQPTISCQNSVLRDLPSPLSHRGITASQATQPSFASCVLVTACA